MTNKLDELINKSFKNKKQSSIIENNLADQLIKNADIALGIKDDTQKNKIAGSQVKNLTFTFGISELTNINNQIERFLKQGKNVNKSELMRIGLRLIELTSDDKLKGLLELITKHPRGRR